MNARLAKHSPPIPINAKDSHHATLRAIIARYRAALEHASAQLLNDAADASASEFLGDFDLQQLTGLAEELPRAEFDSYLREIASRKQPE